MQFLLYILAIYPKNVQYSSCHNVNMPYKHIGFLVLILKVIVSHLMGRSLFCSTIVSYEILLWGWRGLSLSVGSWFDNVQLYLFSVIQRGLCSQSSTVLEWIWVMLVLECLSSLSQSIRATSPKRIFTSVVKKPGFNTYSSALYP